MDIGVDSLRRTVREQTRIQNQIQNQIPIPGRNPNLSGSARKTFASPLGRTGGYPMTPDRDLSGLGSVPMTPTSGRRDTQNRDESHEYSQGRNLSQSGMGYRSPGFRSGVTPTYSGQRSIDSGAGAGSGSQRIGVQSSPVETGTGVMVTATANRAPRRSAYMAQPSPLGKKLNYDPTGKNNSSTIKGINDPRSSLPFNSMKQNNSSEFYSPVDGFSSPLQSKIFDRENETGQRNNDSNRDLSQSELSLMEEQLNAQQSILELAEASVKALEVRLSNLKKSRGML